MFLTFTTLHIKLQYENLIKDTGSAKAILVLNQTTILAQAEQEKARRGRLFSKRTNST
jgi:hypothetical protein